MSEVKLFVVETIHEGTAMCVRRATEREIAVEDEEHEGWAMPLTAARRLARSSAKEMRCQWYDFSSDPAPVDEEVAS